MAFLSDQTFAVFLKFKNLKSLTISFKTATKLNTSVECFKNCKLVELNIDYSKLTEEFFTNIATFVPQLESLNIRGGKMFSDSFIDLFYSIENIQCVTHRFYEDVDDFYVDGDIMCWYFGKRLLKALSKPNGEEVIQVNDKCGYRYFSKDDNY